MASLFEIDKLMLDCVDEETGEIIDIEKLNKLELERDAKIENIALWIRNLISDAEAYKKEKQAFDRKREVAENKAESLKKYLSAYLNGEKFKSTKVSCSYKPSTSVEVDDMALLEKYCKENELDLIIAKTEYKPDKNTIKELINDGKAVAGCRLVEKSNLQIR